jgi:DNA helicase HerA-like ATPase
MTDKIFIGGSSTTQVFLEPRYANRHGLIAGATGTGKTITLQGLAEGFSDMGVPVFLADIKGDLSGLCQRGSANPKIAERVQQLGIEDFQPASYPVAFWDVFGKAGTPVRATIAEMGPQLISRLLDLNEAQESIITLVFEFTDKEGLLLVNLADLRTTLEYLANNSKELGAGFGVSKASVNVILRRLLMLEREGGDCFFGEPALQLSDFMRTAADGRGVINILSAEALIMTPRVYSTFLLWLLSELFESLPELGDPEKPVLVFFFDEAHLLFKDAPKALLEKIEQVVRLIRSKGVGVYFISQSPGDLPDSVLAQLGNRVQHALRAYTPSEQKAVRVAAQSFRANPEVDSVTAIAELKVGEALVSMLQDEGIPAPVQRALIRPPCSRIGAATTAERQAVLQADSNQQRYATAHDPESAHELLLERTAARQTKGQEQAVERETNKASNEKKTRSRSGSRDSAAEAFLKSFSRAAGSSLGRQLLRGVLGSLLK